MLSRIYSWFKVFNNAHLIYIISRTDPLFAIFIHFAIQRRKGAGNEIYFTESGEIITHWLLHGDRTGSGNTGWHNYSGYYR